MLGEGRLLGSHIRGAHLHLVRSLGEMGLVGCEELTASGRVMMLGEGGFLGSHLHFVRLLGEAGW